MAPTLKLAFTFLASAALVGSAAWAGHVREGAWVFTMTLSGAAECNTAGTLCNLGDPTGSGTITLYVNPGQKRICYDLTISALGQAPTAAHIHQAPAGRAGPVVIPFPTPPLGTSSACADATSRQIAALISKPENYYYNVHTPAFFVPGAIRGQFSRPAH